MKTPAMMNNDNNTPDCIVLPFGSDGQAARRGPLIIMIPPTAKLRWDGLYELDLHPLDISSLLRTVTKLLSPQFESKRISLEINVASDLPPVFADEDLITQVVTNPIGNALQYTPEADTITIGAHQRDREVQVTGIGIPAAQVVEAELG